MSPLQYLSHLFCWCAVLQIVVLHRTSHRLFISNFGIAKMIQNGDEIIYFSLQPVERMDINIYSSSRLYYGFSPIFRQPYIQNQVRFRVDVYLFCVEIPSPKIWLSNMLAVPRIRQTYKCQCCQKNIKF